MPEPKPDLEWIAQLARSSSRRSAWGRWLVDHHDEFERALQTKPLWRRLLENLEAKGVPVELPEEWNDEDERIREMTRRRVTRARQKVWDKVHRLYARGRCVPPQAAAAATAGPIPGVGAGAVRDAGIEPKTPGGRTFQPVRPK